MTQALALGLDSGGTQTRWALADAVGSTVASGAVSSIAALQLTQASGQQQVQQVLAELAAQLGEHARQVGGVWAGVSGVGHSGETGAQTLQALLADVLALAPSRVRVTNDMETAYCDAFEPGQGYLIYAGTGSIAAYIDPQGEMHRAGGRGGILDDGGGGYWIAREALRHIWRAEDERPGAWQTSPLAVRVFAQIGGHDWSRTREWVYAGSRGAMGELALAVSAAAADDLVARQILQRAGLELARLGQALVRRFGPRPMALAGRAASLHPVIVQSLKSGLEAGQSLVLVSTQGHVAAARLAARQLEDTAA
jgi:N-acetylglucosamine kinase-like BadF-type ATPase